MLQKTIMRIIIGLNDAKYCQQAIIRFSQPLRSTPVVATVARFSILPIDSNDPVSQASECQAHQSTDAEADCCCTA